MDRVVLVRNQARELEGVGSSGSRNLVFLVGISMPCLVSGLARCSTHTREQRTNAAMEVHMTGKHVFSD